MKTASRMILVILAGTALTGIGYASSEGPIPGMTGAPGLNGSAPEMTCQTCHIDVAVNADKLGKVQLTGVPATYQPGKSYPLTIQLQHPTARRWGFELTALAMPRFTAAGDFVPADKTTQRKTAAGRVYIEHGAAGGKSTGLGKAGGFSWTFAWSAPKTNVGAVAFFAAANMANGNGDMTGDRIYSMSPKPLAVSQAPK